ncbi:MAG TPA: acyloxyacyl hydrolase [Syntrophorhabdaceae bacterium]|nr:acyloxyacyl hydrolase [Syntrophorhabdaceae bacterium]
MRTVLAVCVLKTFCERLFPMVAFLLFTAVIGVNCFADQQTISIGYGLGMLNNNRQVGHLWCNDYYDFGVLTYAYEKSMTSKFNVTAEPFLSYVNRPQKGLDVGLTLNAKYYFMSSTNKGPFASIGGGGVYTTIGFKDQGTHGLFILQGGAGYAWEHLFLEARFRHYSNSSLAHPNRSVNATIMSIGYAF